MSSLNGIFEAGLQAAKISLKVSAASKRAVENVAELNSAQAKRNAQWAEAEGMRAEEEASRRFVSDVATVKEVRVVREDSTKQFHNAAPEATRRSSF